METIQNNLSTQQLMDDLSVKGQSVFSVFPRGFTLFDVRAFEALPALLFPTALQTDWAAQLCGYARLVYLAVKPHILSVVYNHDDDNHVLEYAVLDGDLLSGRFAQRLIADDEMLLLKKWLEYLMPFFEGLTELARQNVSLDARHTYHVEQLMNRLMAFADEFPEALGAKNVAGAALATALAQGYVMGDWQALQALAEKQPELAVGAAHLIRIYEQTVQVDLFECDDFQQLKEYWVEA